MEKHVFKKLFTAAWLALLFTFCHFASAATNVNVTATPSNPTAPATVTLAVSGDSDGNPIMVTKVEYFNGTTSLGVSVQSPFTLSLNNLAAGTYQISVKVTTTDPANPVLQSAPLEVTVGPAPGAATAYFIHTDQLNTPRAITDGSGNLVWQWDSDPFGKDGPNEQPAGQPAFTFNQRFPGQQFDRESNLHYNHFRDYDPSTGRYLESDLIGLDGGINTYAYAGGNSISYIDVLGLSYDVWRGPGNTYTDHPPDDGPEWAQAIWSGDSIIGWRSNRARRNSSAGSDFTSRDICQSNSGTGSPNGSGAAGNYVSPPSQSGGAASDKSRWVASVGFGGAFGGFRIGGCTANGSIATSGLSYYAGCGVGVGGLAARWRSTNSVSWGDASGWGLNGQIAGGAFGGAASVSIFATTTGVSVTANLGNGGGGTGSLTFGYKGSRSW